MRSPIPDYLEEMLGIVRSDSTGERANYIQALATADPEVLSAAFATVDGVIYAAGDANQEISIQSISKPFVYALALADRGFDTVLANVGVEPTGEAFNEISLDSQGRPRNPMINAGAITAHALIRGPEASPPERMAAVLEGLSAFAGRTLEVDEELVSNELGQAHRNLAIAHMLASYGILPTDPRAAVEGYTRQCALLVTTKDLAIMAATLANDGVNPLTGVRVVDAAIVRQVLSVMATCGMYDAAGDWFTQVGIPAKSGVAGGIIGALPGQVGIATVSPRLDRHGNSIRGVSLFERFSGDMGLHLMEVPPPVSSAIRRSRTLDAVGTVLRVVEIQGSIRFAAAERIVREFASGRCTESMIALDLTEADSLDDVARRMLLEVTRRLALEGREVFLIDPAPLIPDPDPGEGARLTVYRSLEDLLSTRGGVTSAASNT